MPRRSKVDISPYTSHYIKLKKNGASLSDISQAAHENGEDISPMSFSRYFANRNIDVHQAIKERLDVIKEGPEQYVERHNEDVSVLKEINRNLWTLQALTSALIQNNPTDSRTVNSCTQLLKESRLTLEYLDKKRKDMVLESEQSEEMAIAALLSTIAKIPKECPHCNRDLDIRKQIEMQLAK